MKIFNSILILSLLVTGCASSPKSQGDLASRLGAILEQYRPLLERDIVLPPQMPYPDGTTQRQWYEEGYREGWNCGILPMVNITKALPADIAKDPESVEEWRDGFRDGKKVGFHAFQEYEANKTH